MSSSIWPQLISFVSVQRSQILRDLVSIQARQARKCLSSGRLRSLDISGKRTPRALDEQTYESRVRQHGGA
jgi:hypothetical protein